MAEPSTYVIRARITASGIIERSDVVGAIFGQTEGLLGNELELRTLQDLGAVGRIDVDIASERGVSTGEITIATDLDRVETAVLAAAIETIDQVGPCRASIEIDRIEDIRAVRRREIVDRAKDLLTTGFHDVGLGGRDLVTAVRDRLDAPEVTDFAGYPAGPGLDESEEMILVEGRADVRRLLHAGITNVVGVEGTGVPTEIADLTRERTSTAFFDGDRGGNLLLLELAQVGNIDFVTFAPPGRSVEDLGPKEIHDALARKVPYEDASTSGVPSTSEASAHDIEASTLPLLEHVDSIIADTGEARLLGLDGSIISDGPVDTIFERLDAIDGEITTLIIDGVIDQRLIDAAVRSHISMIVGRERGSFVKRPTAVRVLVADDLRKGRELVEQAD